MGVQLNAMGPNGIEHDDRLSSGQLCMIAGRVDSPE